MAKYKITFKKSVSKDLRNIAKPDIKKILKRIDQLADDPKGLGCTKLSAQERYRVRVGMFRIIYQIHDFELIVQVIKIGNRSDVYKKN